MNTFANKKVRDAYFGVVGKEPDDNQIKEIRTAGTGGNVLSTAEEYAVNTLDLPDDYKFPDAKTNVSYGQAYSAARAANGPGSTFTWLNPKTGKEEQHIVESREEKIVRLDKDEAKAGKYENNVVTYAKYKLLDNNIN